MDFLNVNSPKFLGGQNVVNLLVIGGLAFAAFKLKQFFKLHKNFKAPANGAICVSIKQQNPFRG